MVAEEMHLPVMCDCELRNMREEQSKLEQLFYSLSSFQVQVARSISLQFKFLPERCEKIL
jgi:hypothetical protein